MSDRAAGLLAAGPPEAAVDGRRPDPAARLAHARQAVPAAGGGVVGLGHRVVAMSARAAGEREEAAARHRAREVLTGSRATLDRIADALLEHETLSADELEDLVGRAPALSR